MPLFAVFERVTPWHTLGSAIGVISSRDMSTTRIYRGRRGRISQPNVR